MDEEREEEIRIEIADWRKRGEFSFPRFSDDAVESFKGEIEYPVGRSPDYVETQEDSSTDGKKNRDRPKG